MSILDKAAELGKMLGKSREYCDLMEAEKALKEDAEAGKLIQSFTMLQQSYERMQMTGYQLTPEHLEKLKSAEKEMMANHTLKVYYRAKQDFNKLYNKVNQRIRESMEQVHK